MTAEPLRRIDHVQWSATEDWLVWNTGEANESSTRLAETMHEDPHMVRAIARGMRALDEDAPISHPGTVSMGVWLPDRITRALAGTVLVRIVGPEIDGRMSQDEILAWASHPGKIKGSKVLHVDASPGRVDAGPAVVQVLETTTRWSRKINTRLSWFIIPPGTAETVLCQFDTEYPALVDALGWETNTVTDSLSVLLEEL